MSNAFHRVRDHFKTQEMCKNVVEVDPSSLGYIINHFKTQVMCNKAAHMDPWLLTYVSDWFVIEQQVKVWHDKIIKWYEG